MEILYINHYAGGSKYGMEYRPFYLAREWVRAGHSVTVVAASQAHVRSRQPELAGDFTEEWVDGVRFVWCQTPEYHGNGTGRVINIFAFLRRLYQHRRWLKGKPDVVIASSTYPLDIFPARHIARKYGARLIWEIHDLWPLSPIEIGGMSPKHPFIRLLQYAEDRACVDADRVISMLPCVGAHLASHGMAAHKLTIIPNGVVAADWQEARVEPLPGEVRDAIAKARDKGHMIIGYAGSHGKPNSLDVLLDAADKLRLAPVTFLLVGDGHEKQRLLARVREEGLDNVILFAPISKASIPTFMENIDAGYLGAPRSPLYRFGVCPNKMIDYMMAGVPILFGIAAGNDPVRESGCGYSFEPDSASALVEVVQKLIESDAGIRSEMARSGQRYALENHTYEVLANKFLEAVA